MAYFEYNDGIGGLHTDTPEKSLKELLIEKTTIAGHMLTFEEASNDPTMVNPNVYAYYFGGSFSEFSKQIWALVSKNIKQGKVSTGRTPYTEETVKAALRDFYEKHHRWPTQTDTTASDALPSYMTIVKYCGKKPLWAYAVYGDKMPIKPSANLDAASNASAKDISSTKVASTPGNEATAELTIDTTKENQTSIHLTVQLPDREQPILLHITF